MRKQSRIYFRAVREPEVGNGKIYYQLGENGDTIEPCIIEDGTYFSNGRISNFWNYLNLITGKRESNYGEFFELVEIDDGAAVEDCKIVHSRIFLKRIREPEIGGEKIYFQNVNVQDNTGNNYNTLKPCLLEGRELVDSEIPPSNIVWHRVNLLSGKREFSNPKFCGCTDTWELCELEY